MDSEGGAVYKKIFMNYNSSFFLISFPIIFLVYYLVSAMVALQTRAKAGNALLLVASYGVLACENAVSCLWLVYVTLVTFVGARILAHSRLRLFFTLLIAFMPLAVLKYYGFACSVLNDIGLSCSSRSMLVPLGISFFTLQAVGYVVDVYRGKIEPETDLLDHSLFLAFFPQIVAGPISRYGQLMPQIKGQRVFSACQATEGLRMLLWGVFLKAVIADRLSLFVDDIANYLEAADGSSLLSMAFFYSFQIYADFAGYSLMAIGTAKVVGFDLPDNFRRPYLSVSVTDFWRRWHISLSSWLRDYVYISLGGNRCCRWRHYVNIVMTFIVSGLWHGANYTFLVWGLLHGVVQCMEKAAGLNDNGSQGRLLKAVRIAITFVIISVLWVVFRMPTLGDAMTVFARIATITDFHLVLPEKYVLLLLMVVVAKDIIDEYRPRHDLFHHHSFVVRWTVYVLVAMVVILFGVFDSGQFIYAKF